MAFEATDFAHAETGRSPRPEEHPKGASRSPHPEERPKGASRRARTAHLAIALPGDGPVPRDGGYAPHQNEDISCVAPRVA